MDANKNGFHARLDVEPSDNSRPHCCLAADNSNPVHRLTTLSNLRNGQDLKLTLSYMDNIANGFANQRDRNW
ncbi:Uncharacterized protein MLTONO_2768 [Mesorhizobium loti]|nr:Uncharacterized protein MLTONO_2768 [Mesorhizobium loti]